jgi:peroxiredoxin
MTTLLSPGDKFPRIDVALVGGATLALPDAFAGRFGVVLFNRGAWCPFCTGQLRAFQRAADKLDALGVSVASVSVDDEATAAGLVAANDLTFPVGHNADARALAAATGAFVNDDPLYIQSTGFILDPNGNVIISVYSSGAIGRLVPEDVLGLVKYVQEHAAA